TTSGITLASDNATTMNLSGGTLTNNRTIATSATGNALTIQSPGSTVTTAVLTVAGTGTINMSGGGALRYQAQDVTNGGITFSNSTSQTVQGGGSILFSTPRLTLGIGTPVSATGASNISMNSC